MSKDEEQYVTFDDDDNEVKPGDDDDDDEAWDCNKWHYCGCAHTVKGYCIKRAPHAVHLCGTCGCIF
ncbi:MAG: hypothetical protein J2P37_25855 [Ktedonobacteraceae bacterium]|nr:hypothetical protein [Ktedonobacteraceae bacterium]